MAAVTGAICIVQILAMGFFAGDQRGLNLVVGAVSFNAYSYKGLVRNELQGDRTWGCPQQNYMPGTYTQVCNFHSWVSSVLTALVCVFFDLFFDLCVVHHVSLDVVIRLMYGKPHHVQWSAAADKFVARFDG